MRSKFAKSLHAAASAAMLAGLLLVRSGGAAFASDVVEVWKSPSLRLLHRLGQAHAGFGLRGEDP